MLIAMVTVAHAQSPQILTFSGRLTTSGGQPVNGNKDITFKIFDVTELEPDLALWFEVIGVDFNGGNFTVLLGNEPLNLLPQTIFDGRDLYLEMTIDAGLPSEETFLPRTRLGSAGNAFHANNANHADNADHASNADNANNALHANNADNANNANHANNADNADYATEAGLALSVAPNTVGTLEIINYSILFEDIGANDASPGDVMKMQPGGVWVAEPDEVGESLWSDDGPATGDIHYSAGKVGIGTPIAPGPNSTLHIDGSLSRAFRTTSVATTLNEFDCVLYVNATGGQTIVTLPSAEGIAGREYTIKRLAGTGGETRVYPAPGETIDGEPYWIVLKVLIVISDGNDWLVLAAPAAFHP
jgi:hypothetical protein